MLLTLAGAFHVHENLCKSLPFEYGTIGGHHVVHCPIAVAMGRLSLRVVAVSYRSLAYTPDSAV